MQKQTDAYFLEGCLRCPLGATERCKVLLWTDTLKALRQLITRTDLQEEMKWGVPVYTWRGKNILSISALKYSAVLSFFKGAILEDPFHLLEQQGNIRAGRIIRFTHPNRVFEIENELLVYIEAAIAFEQSGAKMDLPPPELHVPEALQAAFAEDPSFEQAFFELTPGRQRGYGIYFSQAKKITTAMGRIEKYKAQIFNGIGLNDHYKKQNK